MIWFKGWPFRAVLFTLAALGAGAALADYVLLAARHWIVSTPVLVIAYAVAYWSTGPSRDALDKTPLPMPIRIALAAFVLMAGALVLGLLAWLATVAWEHPWISVPFLLVAGVLVVMALWPERKQPSHRQDDIVR